MTFDPDLIRSRKLEIVKADPGPVETVPADDDEPGTGLVLDDAEILEGEILDEDDPWYRRPLPDRVLPVWIGDREERRLATAWARKYATYQVKYHTWRSPLYAAKFAAYAPRGGYRAGRRWVRWAFDREAKPLRAQAIEKGEVDDYIDLTRLRNDRVKFRLGITGGTGAFSAAAVVTSTVFWPCTPYALLLIAVTLLGWVGRPVDKPMIERAILTSDIAPRLEPSTIVRALGRLGIAEINKAIKDDDGEGITFQGDPYRDGPGWRADIDLPYGVTARQVIQAKERLASGLRRNVMCVWPEADPDEHEGRLILWVGDKPLRKLDMPAWPLFREGKADIFRPLPFGVDVRGRPVTLELIFQNLLVGAMPRQGKTFSMRGLLLAAALDPTVELRIFELKGTGDLSPLKKVAHHYSSGIIDPAIEACLWSLQDLAQELERRSELIRKYAEQHPDLCPENKVTRAMCNDPKLRLKPIVCAIDEAQNLFAHKEFGEEAAELAERIIKVGPALGIMLVLATQKPNSKSLPTNVRSNVILRFALRVADQDTNDMILGTSHYRNGNRATIFRRADLGIGLLLGETDEAQIIRTYYIDNPAAQRITDRALLYRREAGTVTGVAAGELAVIEPSEGLPEHLLEAWPAGEDAVWLEVLLSRIQEKRPGMYGDWDTTDLGNACRGAGIERHDKGRTIKGRKKTQRAIRLEDLRGAVDRRLQPV